MFKPYMFGLPWRMTYVKMETIIFKKWFEQILLL